jgi:hypothetical protein
MTTAREHYNTDPSVLSETERAVLAALRRLRAKGIRNPSDGTGAREAGLSREVYRQARELLVACGLVEPSPRQAEREACGEPKLSWRATPAERLQITRRLALVRNAKWGKALLAGGADAATGLDLTPAELDAVLPPVPCRRTRIGGAA